MEACQIPCIVFGNHADLQRSITTARSGLVSRPLDQRRHRPTFLDRNDIITMMPRCYIDGDVDSRDGNPGSKLLTFLHNRMLRLV